MTPYKTAHDPAGRSPRKLLRLLLELIASGELQELVVGGAWESVNAFLSFRPELKEVAMNADICGLVVAGLRTDGGGCGVLSADSPQDPVRIMAIDPFRPRLLRVWSRKVLRQVNGVWFILSVPAHCMAHAANPLRPALLLGRAAARHRSCHLPPEVI